jgi:hypothetical protein
MEERNRRELKQSSLDFRREGVAGLEQGKWLV